jgi:hypothetical protein
MAELKDLCECPESDQHDGHCHERWAEMVWDMDGWLHLCKGCADGSGHDLQDEDPDAPSTFTPAPPEAYQDNTDRPCPF